MARAKLKKKKIIINIFYYNVISENDFFSKISIISEAALTELVSHEHSPYLTSAIWRNHKHIGKHLSEALNITLASLHICAKLLLWS